MDRVSSTCSSVGVRYMMNFSEQLTCDSSGLADATLGTWEVYNKKAHMEFRGCLLCKETFTTAVLELVLRLCLTFTSRARVFLWIWP